MQNSEYTTNTVPLHSFTTANISTPPTPGANSVLVEQKGNMNNSKGILFFLALIVVAAGTATGFGIQKLKGDSGPGIYKGSPIQQVAGNSIKNGDVFGSASESDFKDSVEGYLAAGGLEGEGSNKLLRAGGESQTVYLTSSVTDLTKFEGMHVKIWGETFKGQKAGWLMDVGRVQIIETQGKPPTEK
jgi:hypothetical protein